MNLPFSVSLIILGCLLTIKDISCKHRGHLKNVTDRNKIVGGEDVSIQNATYMVYILLKKGEDYYQCGGSIISRFFVLTAAHCLEGIQQAFVRVGSDKSNSGGAVYNSSMLMQHPLYNRQTQDYDAGLIRIPGGIQFGGNVARIRLVRRNNNVAAGKEIFVTGWGLTTENGITSTDLMGVNVPVVSKENCNRSYNGAITSRMFCAGQEGKDSCQGDSGGPAVTQDDHLQRGIVSFGTGCARKGYPGVYTNIADPMIRSWIGMTSLA